MKSSYELAMERLAASEGATKKLTDAQKKALADLDKVHLAKIAELEITLKPKIAEARAAGDAEAFELLEIELRAGKNRLSDELEAKKDKVQAGKK